MDERHLDITDMQCWVFRMAQSKWNMDPKDIAKLFKKYDILGFISECYEILHVSSYNCALEDIETLLRNQGCNCIIDTNPPTRNFSDSQKEYRAVTLMRDAAEELSARDVISYEDALFRFAGSKAYGALFDYDTGVLHENVDYLLNLYDS